jgi:uncharacterized spore protein YtfJ
LNQRTVTIIGLLVLLASFAMGQDPSDKRPVAPVTQPASQLANEMAQRLAKDLHVKTVVGEPLKVGSVTLIPIMMIDFSFGGAEMAAPSGPSLSATQGSPGGADGFFTSGEARPLGFVAITKKGIRFISTRKTPAK